MSMKYLCEKCTNEGFLRQPKGFNASNNPDVYLTMVVRCVKHLDDDME